MIDLHSHSTMSDGTDSPTRVVQLAGEAGLSALALTDLERDHEPSRAALEAYGDHDEELLDACVPVYAAWIYASFMMALPRRPELGPRLAEHLRWLRERYA